MIKIFRFEDQKTQNVKKPRKPRAPKVDTYLPLAIERGECWISIQLPIKTISEANRFEHWKKRADRQRVYLDLIKLTMGPIAPSIKLPCKVTLKRFGLKLLDSHDNLPMSFKRIVDVLAEILTGKGRGKGDNDPRITWKYDQEKSFSYGVKIVFEF